MGAAGSGVKLLLDENLSRRIIPRLIDAFPDSTQVALVNLERTGDRMIWEFAKSQDYVIVTKDAGFADMMAVHGYPPKVLLLSTGNCSSDFVMQTLLGRRDEIIDALQDDSVGLVQVF